MGYDAENNKHQNPNMTVTNIWYLLEHAFVGGQGYDAHESRGEPIWSPASEWQNQTLTNNQDKFDAHFQIPQVLNR